MERLLIILSVAVCALACGSGASGPDYNMETGGGSGVSSGDGGSGSGGGDDDGSGISSASGGKFYDAARAVLPVFSRQIQASGSSKANSSGGWESGNPVYNFFYLLQDFNPETDQGVIDTSNIYKTIWETRNFLEQTNVGCEEIDGQTIVSPFDFGNSSTTYDCAFNDMQDDAGYALGGALKMKNDGAESALFGFVWAGSELGAIEGGFDSGTGEFSFDIAVWVNYDGLDDYCYRTDVTGNTESHYFTFRSMKGNKSGHSTLTPILGAGYSKGGGNHFLINVPADSGAERFYCIDSNAGENELKVIDVAGSDTVPEDCLQFEAAMSSLPIPAVDDLACQTSDFNTVGTGLASEGTIYLNYR